MNQCKPGDALETRGGDIVYYVGKLEHPVYPHRVMYKKGGIGPRRNNGTGPRIHFSHLDIIGFSPTPWRPLSLIKPADGQSVFLRIEKHDGAQYKHATAPIRRRSTDEVFWMEVPK